MLVRFIKTYYLFLLKIVFLLFSNLSCFSQIQPQVDVGKLNEINPLQLVNDWVNIQQIGDSNQISVYTQNQNQTSISTTQYGMSNYTELVVLGFTNYYNIDVNQQGNNNYIFDNTGYSIMPVNKVYSQVGDNLTIMSYGVNSISSAMQVNQFGNSSTVLIFNYK